MAFQKKTWKDRVSEQPQRRLITPVGGGTSTTVDVTRQEGIVIQEGDAFSAANMNDLENRIKTTLDADEASIRTINTRSTTNANNIASLQNNVATLNTSKAPTNHASANTTYGRSSSTLYGHTKISDNWTASSGSADEGISASPKAVNSALDIARGYTNTMSQALHDHVSVDNTEFYFDYKNGKYGFNTDFYRGADTFHPFNSGAYTVLSNDTGTSKTYTFDYPYSCAIVFVASVWADAATCTGTNCNVAGGWAHYGNTDEHIGGRMWIVTDISVGSQITWNITNDAGEPGGTIIGIGA